MNISVNRLPSITWNHLNMNESRLALEDDYDFKIPEAESTEDISWEIKGSLAPADFSSGMGKGMKIITAAAPVGEAVTAQGVKSGRPIIISFNYAADEAALSRVILKAEKDSVLNAVMVLSGNEAKLSSVMTELYAGENAVINLYVAQLLGKDCTGLNDISGVCAEGAKINLTKLELGAGRLYAGTEIGLDGRGSSFNADVAYHVLPGQKLDMNYVATHRGRDTESLMEVNGTLEEGAEKLFRGSIDFKRGCAGSRGTENENVLLLSDDIVNQTIPLILCQEEDVEGNHGASIGKLDEKVLFYLGTRGIDETRAQQMIARSKIDAVCAKLPDEDIKALIREFEAERGGFSNEDELQE